MLWIIFLPHVDELTRFEALFAEHEIEHTDKESHSRVRLFDDTKQQLLCHPMRRDSCVSDSLGTAAASSSCKLSLNVSLFLVTRKLAPKNKAPLSLRKESSGITSLAAAPLLFRTACNHKAVLFPALVWSGIWLAVRKTREHNVTSD